MPFVPLNQTQTEGNAFGNQLQVEQVLAHAALMNRQLQGSEMPQPNEKVTLLASAVRSADTGSPDQFNIAAGGMTAILDVTANASSETFTLFLQAKDAVSGNYVNLVNSGVLTSGTGTFAWTPPIPLPRDFRFNVDTSAGNNKTYSLAGQYTRHDCASRTSLGKHVELPFEAPGNTWSYPAAAGGLVNTTGVTAKAAAGAGIRNYVTAASIVNSHQTTSTEVMIRDGAAGTVLWRGWAQAAGGGMAVVFPTPLRGSANTLIEIAEVSTTATAGVLVDLQGYTAAE